MKLIYWKNNTTQSITHTSDSWKPLRWIQAEGWVILIGDLNTRLIHNLTTPEERSTTLSHVVTSLYLGKKPEGLDVLWDFMILCRHSGHSNSVRPEGEVGPSRWFWVSLSHLNYVTFPFNDSVNTPLQSCASSFLSSRCILPLSPHCFVLLGLTLNDCIVQAPSPWLAQGRHRQKTHAEKRGKAFLSAFS